ncbi:MAG: Protein of unknown function precursor, partial [Labilithrix sp.]|nr:Protein of unknown function precursor [Labilithrix sp.]
MTTYAGDPNSWPASLPLLADNTPPSAADIDVPLEVLADRTAYLKALNVDRYDIMPSLSGSWTCPEGVYWVDVIAWGGGGGGGCGTPGTSGSPSTTAPLGGGGGGGAILTRTRCPVVPGTTYPYFVGAGGSGGAGLAGGNSGANGGTDGTDSIFGPFVGGIIVGRGAQGGAAPGSPFGAATNVYPFVPGGQAVRQTYPQGAVRSATPMASALPLPPAPQAGGQGGGATFSGQASEGGGSAQGLPGGLPGTPGSTITNLGGGAGGGGGAGPAGAGG